MVLLPLHQSSGISQAVALLEDCHVPLQLPTSHENGVGNLNASESCQLDCACGVWGCAKAPLVMYTVVGVCSSEPAEVEGDLSSIGPESWHSHPASHVGSTWVCSVSKVFTAYCSSLSMLCQVILWLSKCFIYLSNVVCTCAHALGMLSMPDCCTSLCRQHKHHSGGTSTTILCHKCCIGMDGQAGVHATVHGAMLKGIASSNPPG